MNDFIESNFDSPPLLLLAMHPVQQHPPGDAPLVIPFPFVPSRPPSFASRSPRLMHYVAHALHASVHVRYDSAQDMLIARTADNALANRRADGRTGAYVHTPVISRTHPR